MTSSPKPRPPVKKTPPVTKLTMYVVTDPYGDDFEIRGRDESDVRKVYFDTFGEYPKDVRKKQWVTPVHLTQRIRNDDLIALRRKLSIQSKKQEQK